MEINEELRDQIFGIIENQIKANEPPETRITYNRLRKMGYSDFVTKQYIGQCLAVELFGALKYQKPYNEKRYVKNLQNLPEEPFE